MSPEAIALIQNAAFTASRPWSVTEIRALLAQKTTRLIPDAQGYVLIQILPPEAEILSIAVLPEAQGQGLGAKLLAQAMDRASAEGATRMLLEVDTANAAAIALYDAAGFTRTATRRGYYRHPDGTITDALMMARELGDVPPRA